MSTRYEWRQPADRVRRMTEHSRRSWTCMKCLITLKSGNGFAIRRHYEVCKGRTK